MNNGVHNIYEFGGFRFDSRRCRLRRSDELIQLPTKALEVLALLLEHRGDFVPKEKIFESVWNDTFVEDGVLTQNIYLLRKALGKDSDGRPLIENKSRLGYRISVPVEVIGSADMTDNGTGNTAEVSDDGNATELSPELPIRPRKRVSRAIIIVGIIGLTAISAFAAFRWFRPLMAFFFKKPIETVRFSQLTDTGDLSTAALSPDGKFLAFVRKSKLILRELVTSREIELDVPGVLGFGNLQFSADGNFIYFRDNGASFSGGRIKRTSRLGGASTVIADTTMGSFKVSPDSKFLAYYEFDGSELYRRLMLKNLETNETRQLLGQIFAGSFCSACSPSWSPDGSRILHVTQWWGSEGGQLFMIDTATSKVEELKIPRLRRLGQADWFPDGSSFVISGSEDGRIYHLWKVTFPNLDVQALTVGLVSYSRPFVAPDGKSILAVQSTESANLYVADRDELSQQRQLTSGSTNRLGQMSLVWADQSRIVYSSLSDGSPTDNLWITTTDTPAPKQITFEERFPANAATSDGRVVYYNINRNRLANINRVSVDGSDLIEFTNETDGNRRSPQISPDGMWLYYVFFNAAGSKIMRRNLADNSEAVFVENEDVQCGFFLSLSPDGRHLACFNSRKSPAVSWDKHNAEIALIPVDDPGRPRFIPADANRHPLQFSPDGKALEFTVTTDSGTRIMRQPFDKPEPFPLLNLPKEAIFNFAWSKNGRTMALSRGPQLRDLVLLTDFGS